MFGKKGFIIDCFETISFAWLEYKQSTIKACWKQLLPQMVFVGQDDL
jgi:hypothetical protein